MPVVTVIGGQWGDEGKGHIIGLLASQARMVVRYGGGNNAGHTVVNARGTFKLHSVPSGIFDSSIVNVIGNGVVVDPPGLIKELEDLETRGVSTHKLLMSERAHVIMPYHVMLDKLQEAARGDYKIGTTGRGVGPAYADKMSRMGIRLGDLLHEETLLGRLRVVLEEKNRVLTKVYGAQPLSLHDTYLSYLDYGRTLAEHITDTYPIIQRALQKELPVLLEGAQGVLLDVDYGTYPYVTSSPPGAAGACQGSGIQPNALQAVVGVFKAFATRVGEGPFPTELAGDEADALQQVGTPWEEVVTTTGRVRRVGWFDAVMARYAAQLNGIDTIAITKLDVLDTFATIKICVGYRLHETHLDYPPSNIAVLQQVEPVYEEMPGWRVPTGGIRRFHDLPDMARAYVARLCQLMGARLCMISVGPERDQVLAVHDVFL